MKTLILALLLVVALDRHHVVCDRYIKSQKGNGNMDIDLEDVVMIGILGEGDDASYDYDYSDLTVKPEHDEYSTSKPSSTTTSTSTPTTTSQSTQSSPTTSSSEAPSSPENVTLIITGENTLNLTSGVVKPAASAFQRPTLAHPHNTQEYHIPVMVVTDPTKLKKGYISSSTLRKKQSEAAVYNAESLPKRNCAPGFLLDEKNRCKKTYSRKPHYRQRNRNHTSS